MSEAEVLLRARLRGGGSGRSIFRRQHPIGSLVVDFFCSAAQLAVEVDGATHWDDEAQVRDEARDRWLKSQGIAVVRVPASRVYRDLCGVVDGILLQAAERTRGR